MCGTEGERGKMVALPPKRERGRRNSWTMNEGDCAHIGVRKKERKYSKNMERTPL